MGAVGLVLCSWVVIGEQKISPTLVRPKVSSRANRAFWTKNHPRRNNVHGLILLLISEVSRGR